jgi:anaerobic selenocysteine-containing dehydrogenase/Fe-S cluster biogenesis protein NfuA
MISTQCKSIRKIESITAEIPLESAFEPWGGTQEFVLQYASNPTMQEDPAIEQLHRALIQQSSVCSFCGVGCPYGVVRDNRNQKKLVPLSRLGLCVKGATSLMTGGDAEREARLQRRGQTGDRIRSPMIRKQDGTWQEVSWEAALDRAAWLFLHVREWVGAEGIALYGNGQKTMEAIWMASLYKAVFRVATIGANSEHCLASAGAAHELNFGNEASFTWKEFAELDHCDVVILHGTNPYVTFPQAYQKLKRNQKAVKVVIDPIENDTVVDLRQSGQTVRHIRFEQGGDVLFNLAVMRVILDNGWEDQAFLAKAVDSESLGTLQDFVAQARFKPENVAQQIALEGEDPELLAETIHTYAALIAKPNGQGERPRPAFISSMGINQSTGSYGFSTNLNVLLLTGNVGREGAGSLRIAGQSNATTELMLGFNARRLLFNLDVTNPDHRRDLAHALNIPEHNIADRPGTPVSQMAEDHLLYCFIFIGTQFTRNMPRLGQWLKQLGRSFNIVIDFFLADGVLDYADVILPALSYTERTGVIQRGDRTLQLQQPITEPPPMAWADEQILARLALAIAHRLQDPDTAALNHLDPDVIMRTFGRYLEADGQINSADVFDHIVDVSRQLNVYSRLETEAGEPISHQLLQQNAGLGVQWQGDHRYGAARTQGDIFPRGRYGNNGKAKLVCPPEKFLNPLVARGDEKLRSLVTGRGRPGHTPKAYVARYNSGIKTLPIGSKSSDCTYWIELHPDYAEKHNLQAGDPVRITSDHSAIVGRVSLNTHVPAAFPFLDFVPGEVNRLTNYLESDRFTHQSLVKRTPIRLEALSSVEACLWQQPDADCFDRVVAMLFNRFRRCYPTDTAADHFARGEDTIDWLPLTLLRQPDTIQEQQIAEAVGAMATFFQRYSDDPTYQLAATQMLANLKGDQRDRFLTILLPLLRKLDYHTLMISILNDVVGPIQLLDEAGNPVHATLKAAHKSSTIEIKEEVVGVQLFLAIKQGLEVLYGVGSPIPRDQIAIISGIRIPCSGDVPAYIMGISPADLTAYRLVHCTQIGSNAIIIVNRHRNRAVKIDIATGVLPYDGELLKLRGRVIMKKQAASRQEHGRFFDRLAELIVKFVRVDLGNFRVIGPFTLPWQEFSQKLSFMPARQKLFRQALLATDLSTALVEGLIGLEILDPERDRDLVHALKNNQLQDEFLDGDSSDPFLTLIYNSDLSTATKVKEVIDRYITPVLENDGGMLELLNFSEETGEATVRFLGSCANCPSSLLSVETIVKPPLLKIPGVEHVVHRTHIHPQELPKRVAKV